MADGFNCLRLAIGDGIARVTIDHPPINLLDLGLVTELDQLSQVVAVDDDIRVLVLDSANPEFFIAHGDLVWLRTFPKEVAGPDTPPTFFHTLTERFRTMPKATIAVIEGRARGGGNELALSFDMRFAAAGRAWFGQPEVALGLLPGGGGTQRLPRLVGRGRALELILGCGDVDAATAERWGLVNRALPAPQLRPFVDALARRIASFPPAAVARAKAAVLLAETDPRPGLAGEWRLCSELFADPESDRRMARALSIGVQTPATELDLPSVLEDLATR
jgi:enoyl-CoA hydratase/carnithine racemase